ncbi:MAG: hypothetical protein JNK54_09900 [Elusimicrobia bacterium]|jgi:hypothetical protein|nr:hypothetical protein [Elusimicrobiota bacterium]
MTVPFTHKVVSVVVGALFFGVNSLFAYSSESNFWAERGKQARRKSSIPLRLAALPVQGGGAKISGTFPPFPSSNGSFALSSPVYNSIPRSFFQDRRSLFGALSNEHGTIRKITLGRRSVHPHPVVVYLQDVHQNAEAQRKISSVVQKIVSEGKATVVGLEGTWGEIHLRPLQTFPDSQAVHQAADALLTANHISGPIHGLLTAETPLPLVKGIDDPTHYGANVKAYRDSAPHADPYHKRIQKMADQLENQKRIVFSKRLKEFDRDIEDYRQNKASLGDYVRTLLSHAHEVPPSLRLFSQVAEIEKALDFGQVERERAALIDQLVKQISPQHEEELMARTVAYRAGQLLYADYYSLLKHLCEETGVDLSSYPSMDRYIRYVLLAGQIEAESLLHETKQLEDQVYRSLAETPEERIILDRSRRIHLTRKLVEFSLTPEEWATYQSWPETKGAFDFDGEGAAWDLGSFEKFYEEAQVRDSLLATNLLHQLKNDADVGLLVAGGFHAAGVTAALTAAGVTVISFVPRMTSLETTQGSNALSVFTQEKTPLDQLFDGEKLFLAPAPVSRPVLNGLLPAMVVVLSLAASGLLTGPEANLLYSSLNGIGALVALKMIQDHVSFDIAFPTGSASFSVDLGSNEISSVDSSPGARHGFKWFYKKYVPEILKRAKEVRQSPFWAIFRYGSISLSSLRLAVALYRMESSGSSGERFGVNLSGVGMHLVGVGLKKSQLEFLRKRPSEPASQVQRAEWARQISEALRNDKLRASLSRVGLVEPVRRLIALLRMPRPVVRVSGVEIPIQFNLISGSPEDLPHGMPRAFGSGHEGRGIRPASYSIGFFANDLAALLHEGMEIIVRDDQFSERFEANAHSYAFLSEILANADSDGDIVPKRAIQELGQKSLNELNEFLNKSLFDLIEVRARFKENNPMRARLSEINGLLNNYALRLRDERVQNQATLFYSLSAEIERVSAMGALSEVQPHIQKMERALYHLQRERGPKPFLRSYLNEILKRQKQYAEQYTDAQREHARVYYLFLETLDQLMTKREWMSLFQGINRLKLSRSTFKGEILINEQVLLFGLWDRMRDVLAPVLMEGDWDVADRKAAELEKFGLDVIQSHGIINQYFETVLLDFLAVYRSQRDLAHRNSLSEEQHRESLIFLRETSFRSGSSGEEGPSQVLGRFAKGMGGWVEWEINSLSHSIAYLNKRLPVPIRLLFVQSYRYEWKKRHSSVLQRILLKYPHLTASVNDVSTVFSEYVSERGSIEEAKRSLMAMGLKPFEVDLYLLDMSELMPGSLPKITKHRNLQRGESLLALLVPLAVLSLIGTPFVFGIDAGFLIFERASLSWLPFVGGGLFGMVIIVGAVLGIKKSREKNGSLNSLEINTAKGLVALLQETPTTLGVDQRKLVESAIRLSSKNPFIEFLSDSFQEKNILLTVEQARSQLLRALEGSPVINPTDLKNKAEGERPLTIFYLDGAGVPQNGNLRSVLDPYLLKNRAEILVVPIDERAQKAAKRLQSSPGIHVFSDLERKGEGDRTSGDRYGLANMEDHLRSEGIKTESFTGCLLVFPKGFMINVEGVKTNLFKNALVILMGALFSVVIPRSHLEQLDRLARAVASSA